MPVDGDEQRRRAEIRWRLVDTQCVQLAEAVAGARRPFLVALTWAFVWAVAIFSLDFSYTRQLNDYFRNLELIAEAVEDEEQKRANEEKKKKELEAPDKEQLENTAAKDKK